ncbi:Bacterial regulatory protein, luxR family [Novipirellula aureliae]|uniref:Bacterial regulatory protein, luxR family n=1 Tax=Novipirellula aureliae TaxID=2527966 RepID=A0A5C6E8T5_9BACT|nr:Bacterial regulatory protein, luxR family [Novipirellula aureliae]
MRQSLFPKRLHVIDQSDQRCGVAGDSCAEYVLERCEPLISDPRLAVLENPRAYLAKSAQRACSRYFHRKRKIDLVLQPNGIVDGFTSNYRDPCQVVWDALECLHDELSSRERICAECLAMGFSKKKIAERLSVCPSAVSKLSKQVMRKIEERIIEHGATN